jgi:hypothetical protein
MSAKRETTIGADGRVRPVTDRERYARVILAVLQTPVGIETLD